MSSSEALPHRRGHFLLESGLHGDLWLDLDRFIAEPEQVRPVARRLADRLSPFQPEAIVGPCEGGAVVAALVGEALGLPVWPLARKALASGAEYTLSAGAAESLRHKRVAVVDDAIGAGSAVKGSLARLREAGATAAVVGGLFASGFARAHLPGELGLPVVFVGEIDGHIWAPADCPLCRSNVPLEVPGAMP